MYPELTPASSIPDPTVFPINTDPLSKLLSPAISKLSPTNVTGNTSVSACARLLFTSKYWNLNVNGVFKNSEGIRVFILV